MKTITNEKFLDAGNCLKLLHLSYCNKRLFFSTPLFLFVSFDVSEEGKINSLKPLHGARRTMDQDQFGKPIGQMKMAMV